MVSDLPGQDLPTPVWPTAYPKTGLGGRLTPNREEEPLDTPRRLGYRCPKGEKTLIRSLSHNPTLVVVVVVT
ncbi:MAG: hypothetical protein C0617_00380 [Desulfuromonas sp.]|nr:MAG: hypothetical protein C0617_00380 [Desulfuromonas sp.]